MKKRILFLFTLAFALCACCLFASAQEPSPVVRDHIVYDLVPAEENTPAHYEVVSLFDSEDAMQGVTEITVPAEIDGVPVTAISCNRNHVYTYYDSVVETVNLPDTIETIGSYAFIQMRFLEAIELPAAVKSIGKSAFAHCDALTQITIPANVKSIDFACFSSCKKLTSIQLGDGLKAIGKSAFSQCTALQSLDLPTSLESIGRLAFYRTGLKSVRIPGGCALQDSAFMLATKLKKVVFENRTNADTNFIAPSAFASCGKLLKVYLPKEAAPYSIPAGTFTYCTRLKAVHRTTHVKSVGNVAFEGCKSLSVFTVPAEIESIGTGVFKDCDGFKKLRVLATSSAFLTAKKQNAAFLQTLPDGCKVYVKTAAMKRAFVNAGCTNRVIVKADLK